MVHPDRAGTANNVAGNPAGDQTWVLNARNIAGSAGPQFHAEFQGEHELLLEPPALDSQLRRDRRVHDGVRRGNRAGEERQLLRTGILPAHLDTSCPPAVRLGHSQQPVEPHHDCLGPLVHGREFPFCRCRLAAAAVGLQPGRSHRQHCRTANDEFRRQHALHEHRAAVAGIRLREEQSLAVLERPDMGEGAAHGEGWYRVPPSHVPVPRVGDQHRRRVQLQSPRHGRLRQLGEQSLPDRRSVRVVPAGPGAGGQSDHSGLSDVQRSLHGGVDQRRIQGERQAHADPRDALRLSVRPLGSGTISTRPSIRTRPTPGQEIFQAR